MWGWQKGLWRGCGVHLEPCSALRHLSRCCLSAPVQGESALRAELEAALHEADTQKDALEQRVGELMQEVAQQAGTITSHAADIAQLRDDLAHSRAQERQLAEEKAKLEVREGGGEGKCVQAGSGRDWLMGSRVHAGG